MAKKPAIHTVRAKDGWVNRREGSDRALDKHRTKADAQSAGRDRARKDRTEHFIHNMDGRIAQRSSYGNDPHPPPG